MFIHNFIVRHKIRDLDLSTVRNQVIKKLEWDRERAVRAEIGYKRYLYAIEHREARGQMISPPT